MSDKKIPNGGFPPLRYKEEKKINKDVKKERFFATKPKENINIRQILQSKQKKPMFNLEENNDSLAITDNFD